MFPETMTTVQVQPKNSAQWMVDRVFLPNAARTIRARTDFKTSFPIVSYALLREALDGWAYVPYVAGSQNRTDGRFKVMLGITVMIDTTGNDFQLVG